MNALTQQWLSNSSISDVLVSPFSKRLQTQQVLPGGTDGTT